MNRMCSSSSSPRDTRRSECVPALSGSRAEATLKRARDMLHGELAVALDLELQDVEEYIKNRIGELK